LIEIKESLKSSSPQLSADRLLLKDSRFLAAIPKVFDICSALHVLTYGKRDVQCQKRPIKKTRQRGAEAHGNIWACGRGAQHQAPSTKYFNKDIQERAVKEAIKHTYQPEIYGFVEEALSTKNSTKI